MRHIFIVCCVVMLGLGGCSGDKDALKQANEQKPIEELYNQAMAKLGEKDYKDAIELFESIDRQYPFSKWAKKSLIMETYSHYMLGNYDDTIVLADRFVKQYPTHEDGPYAYYLKAMSYYDQISDVKRDQKVTSLAQDALKELIARYPHSSYARDAKLKIALTMDHLAGKEMEIGRYYLHRGDNLAAIHRFNNVLKDYQETTHTPEALFRLTEAYYALGAVDEARRHAAVLGANDYDSKWYDRAYYLVEGKLEKAPEKKRSWYKFWGREKTS